MTIPTRAPELLCDRPSATRLLATSVLASSGSPPFALFSDGVYELPESGTDEPILICTPLKIDAVYADQNGRGRGRLVSILVDGKWREVPVANTLIECRPSEVVGLLVDHGLELAPDKKSKERLLRVLKTWRSDVRLQTVSRMGWFDDSYTSFAMGPLLIGKADVLPFASASAMNPGLIVRGTEVDWRTEVGSLCRGNPLMILATSLAFSGPLLSPLNLKGWGIHFRGETSCGKSTLLKLATSVWGGEQLITPWNATTNGLEALAPTVNDMLLPLDEIGEGKASEIYQSTYALANGKGKARAKSNGSLAEQAHWRLAMISTGELSLKEMLSEARRVPKDGQEVRFTDVEADKRAFGAFDTLHGASNGSTFSDKVQAAMVQCYGATGRAFVRHLIETDVLHKDDLRSHIDRTASAWVSMLPSASDGQIARVATRFATIALAGTLATKFGLTGWNEEEAGSVAQQAFHDWYDSRYADKRDAVDKVVKPLKDFLNTNLNALHDLTGPASGAVVSLGWRDMTKAYLPKDTWATVYPNVDGTRAAKALIEMKLLLKGDGKHLMCRAPHAIKGRPRLYTVNIERVIAYKLE